MFLDNKLYKAAIYIRISKEDNTLGESNSVKNQRGMLRDFIDNRDDMVLVSEKVDDGYSGTNFNRPALKELLDEIKSGLVDCVVVKDLSRFGRHYIETGRYIEELFPFMGVRFIAVNDGLDTVKNKSSADSIILPFKNLMNDAYARDISIKTRTGLEVRKRRGDFVGAFPAYGYVRSKEHKGKLVIDEVAAETVRTIFALRISGHNNHSIANYLNSCGILSPLAYKEQMQTKFSTPFKLCAHPTWSHVAVGRILCNEAYTGVMLGGKGTTYNYKNRNRIKIPKEEWIRVENTHEAIIAREDFDIVQRILKKDTRSAPSADKVHLFSGFVVCGDCGSSMVRKTIRSRGKTYSYQICSGHKKDKNACSSHLTEEGVLKDIVTNLLKKHIDVLCTLCDLLKEIESLPLKQRDIQKYDRHLVDKKKELQRYNSLKLSVYEDYKDELLTEAEYLEMKNAYEHLCKQTAESISFLEAEINKLAQNRYTYSGWIERFREHGNLSELTRTTLVLTVDRILVFADKRVKIIFNTKNEFDNAVKLLEADTDKAKDNKKAKSLIIAQ